MGLDGRFAGGTAVPGDMSSVSNSRSSIVTERSSGILPGMEAPHDFDHVSDHGVEKNVPGDRTGVEPLNEIVPLDSQQGDISEPVETRLISAWYSEA